MSTIEEVQRLIALVRAQQITIDKLEQALNTATPLAAPTVQEPVAQGSKEHLKVMMEESAFEGRLELSDALANIDEFYAPPAAQPALELTNIQRHEQNVQKFLAAQPAPVQEPEIKQSWDVDTLLDKPAAPVKIGTIGHIDNGKATLTASILSALQATPPAAQPAPVQEPVAWRYTDARAHYRYRGYTPGFDAEYQLLKPEALCLCATAPPAAQPAVPDAFGTREGEHPQYIQGWNDCRAEMLKGMKP